MPVCQRGVYSRKFKGEPLLSLPNEERKMWMWKMHFLPTRLIPETLEMCSGEFRISQISCKSAHPHLPETLLVHYYVQIVAGVSGTPAAAPHGSSTSALPFQLCCRAFVEVQIKFLMLVAGYSYKGQLNCTQYAYVTSSILIWLVGVCWVSVSCFGPEFLTAVCCWCAEP